MMNACAGTCRCPAAVTFAATKAAAGPASAMAALRVARCLVLPSPALFQSQRAASTSMPRLRIARWPLQIGAARIAANSRGSQPRGPNTALFPQQKRLQAPGLRVVNKLQGSNWLSGQGPSFWQLQVGCWNYVRRFASLILSFR